MQPTSNRAMALEVADALLQSWWTIVVGVTVGLAASFFMLSRMDREYQATASLLVTPQRISEDLIQTTVTEDLTRRVLALQEVMLGDEYMKLLIERTHGSLPQDPEDLRKQMRSIRSRVTVTTPESSRNDLIAFDITYTDSRAERAANVVNTLAELYIEQSTAFRTSAARDTTETLEKRLEKARVEYDNVDKRLSEFASQHRFETEEHLDANLRLLDSRQRDLQENLDRQSVTQEALGKLQEQLAELQRPLGPGQDPRVEQLRAELEALLVRYSEVHPEVVRKRRELDDYLASRANAPAPSPEAVEVDPQIKVLRDEIDETRLQATALGREEQTIRDEIRGLERRIQAVPSVQPRLTALRAEHRAAREKYESLQQKVEAARDSEFMEDSLRGERFELARAAEVPRAPVSPKPIVVHGLGVIIGLLVFIGPMLVRRFLNPLVFSEAGLRTLTDVPVLVSIPRIVTPNYKGQRNRRLLKNFGLSAVGAVALAVVLTLVA